MQQIKDMAMKYTKNILFLYISIFTAYCIREFLPRYDTLLTYIVLTVLCFIVINAVYRISFKYGRPIIYTEKRIHSDKREAGMDIARTIAVFFVPLIHFFGLTGYYDSQFTLGYALPSAVRWLALCAVPLFLMITGYFKCNKTICKAHYKAVIPVLATHIFISFVRVMVDSKYHGIDVDGAYIADKILFFDYGWYVRLYIGMLMLMPFFNAAYKYLNEKWKKEVFILTLVGLTALGPLTYDIVPSSWLIIYVFAYYMIGAYLYEYNVKIEPVAAAVLFAGILLMLGKATLLRCAGNTFDWNFIGYKSNSGYSSMAAYIISTLIIIICSNIHIESKVISFPFKAVSMVSLEMYLFSQMFDGFVYKEYIADHTPFLTMFRMLPRLVGTVLILSFIASWGKKLLFRLAKIYIAAVGSTDDDKT